MSLRSLTSSKHLPARLTATVPGVTAFCVYFAMYGFHRHFMGHRDDPAPLSGLVWCATATEMTLLLPEGHRTHDLVARAERVGATTLVTRLTQAWHRWSLGDSFGWYDIRIVAPAAPRYLRRVSGRVDAPGRMTCSDPFVTRGQPV